MSKKLIFNMKKKWWTKIKNNEKHFEIRPVSKFFKSRIDGKSYEIAEFRKGYTKDPSRIFTRKIDIIDIVSREIVFNFVSEDERKYLEVEYPDTKEFYIIYLE